MSSDGKVLLAAASSMPHGTAPAISQSKAREVERVFSRYKGDSHPPIENRNGVLYIGGCSTLELAARYDTPLYVYNEQRIRANYRRLLAAFRSHYPNFVLAYAVKANNNLAVLRILEQEGAGADASNPNEIYLALKAGFAPDRILYSGNYHSKDELIAGYHSGARMNLDDISQIRRMIELGLKPEFLSFRINPGIGASGPEGLVFAGPEVKFGMMEEAATEAYRMARDYGVREFGVHMMTGSNILNPKYFEKITEILMDIISSLVKNLGIKITLIDIGGGFGIPYRPEDETLPIEASAENAMNTFKRKLAEHSLPEIKLMIEPGRYLVGDAGVLLATIHSIKRADKTFLGGDAGMNTLLRPALYDAYHPILLAGNLEAPDAQVADVVGKICEQRDHLARDRELPGINEGDLIAILNAGAYGFSMASNYNTRLRPAEVLVNGDKHDLIRRWETFEDLIRLMIMPEWLKRK